VVLASASPRRRLLLQMLGIPHEVASADVDEKAIPYRTAREYVVKAAYAKAGAVAERYPVGTIVIGADTEVVLDDHILGKPEDAAHAREMLAGLSGRAHRVLTGVAIQESGKAALLDAVESKVHFRELAVGEISTYVETAEPMDKAGGYGIQGHGGGLIERIEGDYFNIVGLPIAKLVEMLSNYMDVQEFRGRLRELTPQVFEERSQQG